MRKAKLRRAILSLDHQRCLKKDNLDTLHCGYPHWIDDYRDTYMEQIDREFMITKNQLISSNPTFWGECTRPFRNAVRWFWRGVWIRRERNMRATFLIDTPYDLVNRKVIAGYEKDSPPPNELAQTLVDTFYQEYDKAIADNRPL